MTQPPDPAFLQRLSDPLLTEKGITLYLKREDLLHPGIPGNKWRKLKYNLEAARAQGKTALLTFGGAYSNHIAAVAAAGPAFGFATLGFIRGEEHLPLNPTLSLAVANGMQLLYLDRESYRRKSDPGFWLLLQQQYPQAYLLPEGGTNNLAVQGCTEIIPDIELPYEVLCCAVGTGGTLAGIIAGLAGQKQVVGFPALKGGDFLAPVIRQLVQDYSGQDYPNWHLETAYHFGGYAKVKPDLISFIRDFKARHQVLLDPVYTGKMMYGLFDLIRKDHFPPGTVLVALHTGGQQGALGLQERLGIAF
jgi:1-aminocyclopropane-1-carboxylate deaminase/D-cysteine desulfhydrase-like pyridoxal-dependent ACC family enzyme